MTPVFLFKLFTNFAAYEIHQLVMEIKSQGTFTFALLLSITCSAFALAPLIANVKSKVYDDQLYYLQKSNTSTESNLFKISLKDVSKPPILVANGSGICEFDQVYPRVLCIRHYADGANSLFQWINLKDNPIDPFYMPPPLPYVYSTGRVLETFGIGYEYAFNLYLVFHIAEKLTRLKSAFLIRAL